MAVAAVVVAAVVSFYFDVITSFPAVYIWSWTTARRDTRIVRIVGQTCAVYKLHTVIVKDKHRKHWKGVITSIVQYYHR